MLVWRKRILAELSLRYSIVYHYNGVLLWSLVSRLEQALILLGLALYLPSTSVSFVFMVLYVFSFFVTFYT